MTRTIVAGYAQSIGEYEGKMSTGVMCASPVVPSTRMADESPVEEPENKEPESPTLDQKYVTRLRNKRPVAKLIAFGTGVLAVLVFANNIIEQGEKFWYRIHPPKVTEPAPFAARVNLIMQPSIPWFYLSNRHTPRIWGIER